MKKRKDFENTKEYIEYLIYEENILNTKNILFLLIIIGSISIISLQFNTLFQSKFDGIEGVPFEITEMQDALVQAGYSQEEVLELSEDDLRSLYTKIFLSNKGQEAGNSKYSEYPEQEASILKQAYYLKASKGDFDSIVTDFEDKKLKYFFSQSYNKELITIYNDAYYLKTIIEEGRVANNFNVIEVLKNIKDPQMLLYGTLLSKEDYRRDIFVDIFSLSPVLIEKHVRVDSIFSTSMSSIYNLDKDKKDSKFNEMAQYLNGGNYIFYKIGFTIDNNNLTAYIYKNIDDLTLSFYGIYSNNSSAPYLKVYDYLQIDNNGIPVDELDEDYWSNDDLYMNVTENENIPTEDNQEYLRENNEKLNEELYAD